MYYVRGHFIQNSRETLILDPYATTSSFLVGFNVSESLVTPEQDDTLLDNSTGSTNFAAKGAHRLKFSLSLTKLDRGTVTDENFVQLMDVKDGVIRGVMDRTPYAELEPVHTCSYCVVSILLNTKSSTEHGNFLTVPSNKKNASELIQ